MQTSSEKVSSWLNIQQSPGPCLLLPTESQRPIRLVTPTAHPKLPLLLQNPEARLVCRIRVCHCPVVFLLPTYPTIQPSSSYTALFSNDSAYIGQESIDALKGVVNGVAYLLHIERRASTFQRVYFIHVPHLILKLTAQSFL